MLTVAEGLEKVLAHAHSLPPRTSTLAQARCLTLAEDIAADLDSPPFDKALVDGYAVRSADLRGSGTSLRVIEEVPAGRVPVRAISSGEAVMIMTGAPLPAGADAVVMIERTKRNNGQVFIDELSIVPGRNVLARGREMRASEVVLSRGSLLNAVRLGLLAAVGRTSVSVVPRPRIAIVSTGDELVEPGQVPGPGQIRNSNATVLRAMAESAGGEVETLPIAPDEPAGLHAILERGLSADVLLITGGVSAGNRDLVPDALERLGVSRVFHKIRLKPGKPLWFGVGPARGNDPGPLVFGLPGNPVSGFVGFVLFVRPSLDRLAGRTSPSSRPLEARLARTFVHAGDRPTYHPSRWVAGVGSGLEPLEWAGSADLRTITRADGFAVFPAGDRVHEAGEFIPFLPLE